MWGRTVARGSDTDYTSVIRNLQPWIVNRNPQPGTLPERTFEVNHLGIRIRTPRRPRRSARDVAGGSGTRPAGRRRTAPRRRPLPRSPPRRTGPADRTWPP